MSGKIGGKLIRQSVALVEALHAVPDMSAAELQAILDSHEANGRGSYVGAVIAYVRNMAGDEVLVCTYNRDRKAFTYRLGLSAREAYDYIAERKVKVRNEVSNLVGILDRTDVKWPGDADIRIARAMLASVVMILDSGMATTPGTSAGG